MGPNPITWQEIDSYCRQTFAGLTVWEKRLIRRIDDIAIGKAVEKMKTSAKPGRQEPEPIPITDTAGLKALFSGIKAQRQS